jgi:protein-tyrosine phosphatase
MQSRLYLIDGPWAGRLAIMPRPRGGDWLADDVKAWRRAGLDIVVSLLTPPEVSELGLGEEESLCKSEGMHLLSFPIPDRGVPASRKAFLALARRLERALMAGKGVAVHCRQGIGRSALLAACLLVVRGESAEAAFQRISLARECAVPDTAEQKEWLKTCTGSFAVSSPKRL